MSGSENNHESYESESVDSSSSSVTEEEYTSEYGGSIEQGDTEVQEFVPKNPLLSWSSKAIEVVPIDLRALGVRGLEGDPLVTDELRAELERDLAGALSYSRPEFLIKVFSDPNDPLLYRFCFSTLLQPLLNYSLFIVDVLVPVHYPADPVSLSSPNTPSRILSELLSFLGHAGDPSSASPDQNRIDKIAQRANMIFSADFSLSKALEIATEDESSFNFYVTFVKIKHHFKDVYFSSFEAPVQDWKDFVLMHCSRFLPNIRNDFDQLYSYSETMVADSAFFKDWIEPGSPLKGEFCMDLVDDLINIFEQIRFEPQMPALEWADSMELEPVPTELYSLALSQYRYNSFSLLDSDGEYRHELKRHLAKQSTMESKTKRFMNEMKALSHGLPCTAPNSIFVVADSCRMDLLKALVAGPAETPYAHGLFLFDVLCPEDYPYTPPKVVIVTTGDGTVRFNPNLYNDGFVCLSIINTWDGDPEERWNPARSNLLQVLVSIQALVMDDHVIHKEPGYEDNKVDYPGNVAYCNIVRYGTVKYAMLDLLNNTPPEFKEVILQHFTLKKNDILRTVKHWLDEARDQHLDYTSLDPLVKDHNRKLVSEFKTKGYYKMLEEVAVELKARLDQLPDVASEADLERLGAYARETECSYRYRPVPPQREENLAESMESESDAIENLEPENDDFELRFSPLVKQDEIDLVNCPQPHSYLSFPESPFENELDSEFEQLSQHFDLLSHQVVFVLFSRERKNLWRVVASLANETCLSNGVLIFDLFVSDEGVQACKLLNFRGLKLYSFIQHDGEVDLNKLKKTKKRMSVARLVQRFYRVVTLEERKASLDTRLLLAALNMKFCMIELLREPWPHLDPLVRDLLQAKRTDIEAEIENVFEIMDTDEDSLEASEKGLKPEIEQFNPQLIEEIKRRGSLKVCFQETTGLLISTLNG